MTNRVSLKKYPFFRKISLHKLFQSKMLICNQNHFFWGGGSFIWKPKAKGFQSTLDLYHDQRIWGRNDFANFDNAVLLPPKNDFFLLVLDKNPWKVRTLFQMTYTIGIVWPRLFIKPGLGVSRYFDFGAKIFYRSGHHIVPISCNASKVRACLFKKNPVYGRQSISRPMRIVAPMP